MAGPLVFLAAFRCCFVTAMIVFLDFGRLVAFGLRSRRALAAENLFLRKQLALFQERKVKPRRAADSTRWMMATLSRMFTWRDALWNGNGTRSSVGAGKDSVCFGDGNRSRPEDRSCPRTCAT